MIPPRVARRLRPGEPILDQVGRALVVSAAAVVLAVDSAAAVLAAVVLAAVVLAAVVLAAVDPVAAPALVLEHADSAAEPDSVVLVVDLAAVDSVGRLVADSAAAVSVAARVRSAGVLNVHVAVSGKHAAVDRIEVEAACGVDLGDLRRLAAGRVAVSAAGRVDGVGREWASEARWLMAEAVTAALVGAVSEEVATGGAALDGGAVQGRSLAVVLDGVVLAAVDLDGVDPDKARGAGLVLVDGRVVRAIDPLGGWAAVRDGAWQWVLAAARARR